MCQKIVCDVRDTENDPVSHTYTPNTSFTNAYFSNWHWWTLLKSSSTVLKPSATSQSRVCQTVSKYSAKISRNIWRGIVHKCPKLAKKRCMTPITWVPRIVSLPQWFQWLCGWSDAGQKWKNMKRNSEWQALKVDTGSVARLPIPEGPEPLKPRSGFGIRLWRSPPATAPCSNPGCTPP